MTVPAELDHGAIVAVADLVDVVTKARAGRFGNWFSGKYGLILANVRQLKRPVKTPGKLNLYRPSSAVIRYVEGQLERK